MNRRSPYILTYSSIWPHYFFIVTSWPISSWRCISALTAATQRCLGGSGCGRNRSGSPWPASWWFYRWHTGSPPGPSWFCAGYSIGRLCRIHSSVVCRPGCWCSSYRRGGQLCHSSPSSGTCCLSVGREERMWTTSPRKECHSHSQLSWSKLKLIHKVYGKLPKKYLWHKLCQLRLVLLAVTGSDHTQSALLHHLTPTVLIGDPGGQAHAASLRAGAPLCGLLNAVQAGIPTVKTHSFLLTISCRNTKVDGGSGRRKKSPHQLVTMPHNSSRFSCSRMYDHIIFSEN